MSKELSPLVIYQIFTGKYLAKYQFSTGETLTYDAKCISLYGHEFTVQDFFVTPNLLGVQFFKVKEKRLAIVQMIMSNVNYICVKGEDN